MHTSWLQALGVEALSLMQQEARAEIGRGRSVRLLSPTGTGKTLAYLLPLAELGLAEPQATSVIIVPSRELAEQIYNVFVRMKTSLVAVCLHGGRPVGQELAQIAARRPQLIVATTGRLLDHICQKHLDTGTVSRLVIDEYDKCLELGFQEELQDIACRLSCVRQWVLASGSKAKDADVVLPRLDTSALCTINYLNQKHAARRYCRLRCGREEREEALMRLLSSDRGGQTLVFVAQREGAEQLDSVLKRHGFASALYHGGLPQESRERAVFRFRSGCANVLVATDLAARGLDITGVRLVVHFDPPLDEVAALHRNGRTARWNEGGTICVVQTSEESEPTSVFAPEEVPAVEELDWGAVEIAPPVPQMQACYIGIGRCDKVSRFDVLGFICKEGGLTRADVGLIEVGQKQTYVAMRREVARDACSRLDGKRLKGIRTLFELLRR